MKGLKRKKQTRQQRGSSYQKPEKELVRDPPQHKEEEGTTREWTISGKLGPGGETQKRKLSH